ncbi:MAG: hypothetical protein CL902_00875 [Dehalococcoidia bacterium]|nr:hypothetical protein [Dehalococcoidia bacterium]
MPVQPGAILELSAGPATVMARLGRGSFGEVFHIRDGQGKDTALKLEKDRKSEAQNERARRQIMNEHTVYTTLQRFRGFPRVYGVEEVRLTGGTHTGLNMQRLGPSLAQMQRKCPRGVIPEEHLIIVFRKALDRLRSMHRAGFVHRDIKPDNLMLGRHTDGELYLIDMGLATRFITPSGTHIPPRHRPNGGITGTARYAALHVHDGHVATRRSDVESLLYAVAHLGTGSLPWQNIYKRPVGASDDTAKRQRNARIAECKRNSSAVRIFAGLPVDFSKMLRYVRGLGHSDAPDYERLDAMLQKIGRKFTKNSLHTPRLR